MKTIEKNILLMGASMQVFGMVLVIGLAFARLPLDIAIISVLGIGCLFSVGYFGRQLDKEIEVLYAK